MQRLTGSIATIGLTAIAAPVAAQDFYAGLSFSTGNFTSVHNTSFGAIVDTTTQSFSAFGGVRFDIQSGFFAGVEVESSNGTGFMGAYPYIRDDHATYQGEVHVGYDLETVQIYGFLGLGVTDFDGIVDEVSSDGFVLGGLGVDIPVHENVSVRVEAELSRISLDDSCCGSYDVEMNDFSLGIIYNF